MAAFAAPAKRRPPQDWQLVEVSDEAQGGCVAKYFRHDSGMIKMHRWGVFAEEEATTDPIPHVTLRMREIDTSSAVAAFATCLADVAHTVAVARASAATPSSSWRTGPDGPSKDADDTQELAEQDETDANGDAGDDAVAPHAGRVRTMLRDFRAWTDARKHQSRRNVPFVGPHDQSGPSLEYACEQMVRSTSLLSATLAEMMLRSEALGDDAFTFSVAPPAPLVPSTDLCGRGIHVVYVDPTDVAATKAVTTFCFKEKTIYPDYRRADWYAKLWAPGAHVFAARDALGAVFGVMTCYLMRTVAGAWVLEVATLQVNRVGQLERVPDTHDVFLGTHFLEQATGIVARLGGGHVYAQTVSSGRALPFWKHCPLANGPIANLLLLQLAHRGPMETQGECVPMSWYIPAAQPTPSLEPQ